MNTIRIKFSLAFALLLLSLSAFGQNPPFDVFPDVEKPYYRVRYEAADTVGALTFPVSYTLWIPPGVETLSGLIVHQHGCGWGSCSTGLTGAYDLHWQALAKKHNCALIAASYEQHQGQDCALWCDPRNGSDARFCASLDDLAEKTDHPELSTIPWALWGHSGGGAWVGFMTLLHPGRVAAVWLNSGIPIIENNPSKPDVAFMAIPKEALKIS